MPRKATPKQTETNVITKSGRRCCFCFALDGDPTEKHGQIAHLDRNPENDAEDNLAWLCLMHHALYDSTSRQHKGYTPLEAKQYRAELYQQRNTIRAAREGYRMAFVELLTKGTSITEDHNVLGVTDSGEGFYGFTFVEDFPDSQYTVSPIGVTPRDFKIVQQAPGSLLVQFNQPEGDYIALKMEHFGSSKPGRSES
jgi:hypothetical protein